MSLKHFPVLESETNDGTAVTIYSKPFDVGACTVWSAHFEWDETVATYASAVTLWASNKEAPGEGDDTDWVQMVSGHGYDGLPGGDPAGGDGKDLADISASGALWYRFKVVRSTGTASVSCWVTRKPSA